jgi:hypothetical protein
MKHFFLGHLSCGPGFDGLPVRAHRPPLRCRVGILGGGVVGFLYEIWIRGISDGGGGVCAQLQVLCGVR